MFIYDIYAIEQKKRVNSIGIVNISAFVSEQFQLEQDVRINGLSLISNCLYSSDRNAMECGYFFLSHLTSLIFP